MGLLKRKDRSFKIKKLDPKIYTKDKRPLLPISRDNDSSAVKHFDLLPYYKRGAASIKL
jgi:hypothetical protein